jgi:Domain of unknown function (DUF4349)
MRKIAGLGIAGVVLLAWATGCSSGSNSAQSGAAGAQAPASGGAGRAEAPASQPGASASGRSSGTAGRVTADPALVKTAELSVTVADVAAQARRAALVATEAGGDVYAGQRNYGPTSAQNSADLVLKVPPSALDTVLDQLAALGQEVSRRISTEDVTEQVADVDSRVRSATASLSRLRVLYGRAGSIQEITALEADVSQRESDLESLQARQRALAQQTGSATVNLHLAGKAAPAVPAAASQTRPTGFWSGLKRGWHAFATSVGWVVTVFGALLPFLLLAGALGYAGWLLRRRVTGRAPAQPPG